MQKGYVYVIILKIALLLVKIYILVGEKGISGLVSQVAAKSTAQMKRIGVSVVVFSNDNKSNEDTLIKVRNLLCNKSEGDRCYLLARIFFLFSVNQPARCPTDTRK